MVDDPLTQTRLPTRMKITFRISERRMLWGAVSLLLISLILANESFAQVIIRERASIVPRSSRQLATLADVPASEARIVADYTGTLHIFQLFAYQTESRIPSDAFITVSSPSCSQNYLLSEYCSYHYWGQWQGWYFNDCTRQWVWEDDMYTVDGVDRTIFFPVNAGDTVQFAYWSNASPQYCAVDTNDTIGKVTFYSPEPTCYTHPQLMYLEIHYAYADTGFAKLTVEGIPDTLVYGDSLKEVNPLIVTAKSTGDHEVQISDELQIQVGSSTIPPGADQCFGFVSPQGDTLRTNVLQNVRYVDLRTGKYKAVALSKPPDSTQYLVLEAAPPPSTGAENGIDSIAVGRPKCNLRLAANRAVIRPIRDGYEGNYLNPLWYKGAPDSIRKWLLDLDSSDTTRVKLTVTSLSGQAAKSYRVTFRSYARQYSGGHVHTGDRPTGRFISAGGDTSGSCSVITDSLGQATVIYLTSGIAGIDSVLATGQNQEDTAFVLISMRDTNILAFPPEIPGVSHYHLIGEKPQHPRNHFATQTSIDWVQMLSDSVYAGRGYVLQLNDMSLENGGPFDCAPTVHEWDTPHVEHREGRNFDIRKTSYIGNENIDLQWLKLVAKDLHITIWPEADHWHLTVQ